MVGTGSSAYYVVSYTDKDGVFHKIVHETSESSVGTETTKEFAEVETINSTSELGFSGVIGGIKKYQGNTMLDLGGVSESGTLGNAIKHLISLGVHIDADDTNNVFAIKNINNETIGSITLGTNATNGAAELTFAAGSDSFTASLPNLAYDSSNQMLKMVEADGTQTNLIKMSNLQIKGVGSTLPYWDTTATPAVSREANDATGAPHWAVGDLYLVEDSSTTPSTYNLHVCTSATDDGTYYVYTWENIGSINNVSLQADQVEFTPISGLSQTNVQDAIEALVRLINKTTDTRLATTVEEGFYIVDSEGNIGLKLDENGFDVATISTHLRTLIQNINGGGSSGGDTVIIESEKSWTANILLIGNSYSADAVAYLPKLLEMTNLRDFTIGILYQGSTDLAYHKNSLTGTANTYTYWEFAKTNGYWSQETSVDIFTGIDKKRWDFILTHQLSNDSTNITKIDRDLPIIVSKIKEYLNESYVPKFGYVLTPAWGHTNASYSDPAQSDTMWSGINNVGKHILELKSTTYSGIDLLVPIHTAIQNARTNATLSEYGADLQVTRSDKHIERGIGRLIQAFTFYKSIQEYFRNDADWSADYIWKPINGTNVIRADYTPQTTTWFPLNDNTNGYSFNTITDTALASAINAVKLAVWNSFNITTIK